MDGFQRVTVEEARQLIALAPEAVSYEEIARGRLWRCFEKELHARIRFDAGDHRGRIWAVANNTDLFLYELCSGRHPKAFGGISNSRFRWLLEQTRASLPDFSITVTADNYFVIEVPPTIRQFAATFVACMRYSKGDAVGARAVRRGFCPDLARTMLEFFCERCGRFHMHPIFM